MSLADEIERAKKEATIQKQQYEEGKIEAQRLYLEMLDNIFSKFYETIVKQDKFFIEKIQSLEIVNTLDELRRIANLNYGYTTKKVDKEMPSLFGSKLTTETVSVPIPAIIEISRDVSSGVYNGANIKVFQNNDSSWEFSLTDYHNWQSYYNEKGFSYSTVEKDFQKIFDKRINEIKSLETTPTRQINIRLLWNFRYGDSDFPNSDTVESITVQLSKNEIEISSSEEYRIASIPLDKCTSHWIKQKIAESHVKHNFR